MSGADRTCSGLEVVRVVGEEWAERSHELRELLGRNGIPFGFYAADSPNGQRVLEEAGAAGKDLPTVVLFDGRTLADPSNTEIGEALGVQTKPGGGCYDVTVIGAGPAGLAAAVYGASEGLSTVVLEPEAIGGQAGTSSLIRNYLGFPTGSERRGPGRAGLHPGMELRRGVRLWQPGDRPAA